jgi:hypothetical protein
MPRLATEHFRASRRSGGWGGKIWYLERGKGGIVMLVDLLVAGIAPAGATGAIMPIVLLNCRGFELAFYEVVKMTSS